MQEWAESGAAAAGRAAVLMYHRITPESGTPAAWRPGDAAYTISASQFREHLDYLQEAGYQTVLPEDLWRWCRGQGRLPARPVVLTFDDGDPSHCAVAAAELARREMKGAFFLIAGRVGDADSLGWWQLAELRDQGHTVGSHGVTHRAFSLLPREELEYELAHSQAMLEQGLGMPVVFASVPQGGYHRHLAAIAQRLGYLGAFTSYFGDNRAWTSPFAWRRVTVRAGTTRAVLAQLCRHAFPRWQAEQLKAQGPRLVRGLCGERCYQLARRRMLAWRGGGIAG